jgi:hypothetical protein
VSFCSAALSRTQAIQYQGVLGTPFRLTHAGWYACEHIAQSASLPSSPQNIQNSLCSSTDSCSDSDEEESSLSSDDDDDDDDGGGGGDAGEDLDLRLRAGDCADRRPRPSPRPRPRPRERPLTGEVDGLPLDEARTTFRFAVARVVLDLDRD